MQEQQKDVQSQKTKVPSGMPDDTKNAAGKPGLTGKDTKKTGAKDEDDDASCSSGSCGTGSCS